MIQASDKTWISFEFQAQAAAAQAELAGTNSDGVKFGGMGYKNNLLCTVFIQIHFFLVVVVACWLFKCPVCFFFVKKAKAKVPVEKPEADAKLQLEN